MDELLIKYLIGEADKEEERAALDWINARDKNLRHFNQLKYVWKKSKALEPKAKMNEEEAWERFKILINEECNHSIPFQPRKKNRLSLSVAAAALVILGTTVFAYLFQRSPEVIISAYNQVLTDTLPDGSVVTLNKNATLIYGKQFNRRQRNVQLKGEGFFQVTPNSAKPFLIQIEDVTVRVIGTSFNVKQTNDNIEVIVETGVVKVAKKSNAVQLLPKQKAMVFHDIDKPVVEQNDDDFYNYYRTKEFVCIATPLWKLIDALNDAYNAQITITNPHIRNLTITTTFKNNSINEIITILTQTLNIQAHKKDGQIILE